METFDGVTMVLVPPGCFLLGSASVRDAQARPEEQPITRICFKQPYWIDQTPVTQGQFKQLNGHAVVPSYFAGDNRPVEGVTWAEAKTFCEQQRGGRLPTEPEYEYAARGPDNLIYPWGNTFSAANVIYAGNSGGQTADVGSKTSGKSWVNALDMSGNVWEWTGSVFKPYPYVATDGREDSNNTRNARALRGGSWDNDSKGVRAAIRFAALPTVEGNLFGFRCAHAY
jgi:formylglycine-generating enzyme required for sulfatase activity